MNTARSKKRENFRTQIKSIEKETFNRQKQQDINRTSAMKFEDILKEEEVIINMIIKENL